MVRGTLQWAEIDSLLLPSTLLIPNVGSGTHRPVRHERIQTVCYLSCNSTASYSSWSYSCGQRKPSAAEAVNTKQMLTAMSRSVRRRGPGRTRTRARAGRRSCDVAQYAQKEQIARVGSVIGSTEFLHILEWSQLADKRLNLNKSHCLARAARQAALARLLALQPPST